jgi:hypothetical protein
VPCFFTFHANGKLEIVKRDRVVAPETLHSLMPADLHYHPIWNTFSAHLGYKTVPEIMETKVLDTRPFAGNFECCPDVL